MNEIIMIGQEHDTCTLCPSILSTGEATPCVLCPVPVHSKKDVEVPELVQRRAMKLVEN